MLQGMAGKRNSRRTRCTGALDRDHSAGALHDFHDCEFPSESHDP